MVHLHYYISQLIQALNWVACISLLHLGQNSKGRKALSITYSTDLELGQSFHKFQHNTWNELTVYTLVQLMTCKLPQAEQITFQTTSWLLLELLSQLCHRVARPKRKNTKKIWTFFLRKSSKIYYEPLGFLMWIQITWFLWSQLTIETVSF